MWRRLVVVAIAGCGVPPPPTPVVRPRPITAMVTAAVYEPPPASPALASHRECRALSVVPRPAAAAPGPRGSKTFDFEPMPLAPIRQGPRTADRPRLGLGRTTRDLRGMFAARSEDITHCWKAETSSGRAKHATTALTVGVTIEPLGTTRDLVVAGEHAEDPSLATCVAGALANAWLPGTTAQPIRLTARLVFERSDQPAWQRALAAPVMHPVRDLREGTLCTDVLDGGALALVELPKPLTVTDWDPSRDPPSRNAAPQLRIGCAITFLDPDKRAIRMAVRSNYGALQTCYADALARDPALTGEIATSMTFDRSGSTRTARVTSGPGDPALRACVVAALSEIWVSPPPHDATDLNVNLTFTLAPPSPPAAADDPVALLARGDAAAALTAWTAKLRTPVSAELACRGRAGVLLSIAEIEPWFDGPRFRAAIADLARAAAVLSPEAARTCVAPVSDSIEMFTHARGMPGPGDPMTHVWLARYAAALPLAPYLEGGAVLRWFHASALLATSRREEGVAELGKLAWDPKIGAAVAKELEARTSAPTEAISDTCSQ